MFRGVKQEAENARRQLRPPDTTKVEELIARRMAELMHRGIDVRNRIIYYPEMLSVDRQGHLRP